MFVVLLSYYPNLRNLSLHFHEVGKQKTEVGMKVILTLVNNLRVLLIIKCVHDTIFLLFLNVL